MIPPLEEAGYGVVVFDYPFNHPLEESCARFRRDWQTFRRLHGETRPWAIVAHSMGALVARALVEDPAEPAGEVSTLILIAPVSQGSSLARAQALRQWLQGLQTVAGKSPADPLAYLGNGEGEAAIDILPGSAFLTTLNGRPRRAGVAYHILAGDSGFMPLAGRRRIEAQLQAMRQQGGLLAGLSRVALPRPPRAARRALRRDGRWLRHGRAHQARRRDRPCHGSRQPRRAHPRPPAVSRPRPGREHALYPALAQGVRPTRAWPWSPAALRQGLGGGAHFVYFGAPVCRGMPHANLLLPEGAAADDRHRDRESRTRVGSATRWGSTSSSPPRCGSDSASTRPRP